MSPNPGPAEQRATALHASLLQATSEELIGCALLTPQGFVLSSTLPPAWLTPIGTSSAWWRSGQQLCGASGWSSPRESLLITDDGMLVIRPVSAEHLLLLVAPPQTSLGWVRVAADHAQATMRKLLEAPLHA